MEEFAIERLREYGARIAIVLGSGLSSLVREPPRDRTIPYNEIAGLPRSTVKGHAGRFVFDQIGETRVVFAQGRVHLYEGHGAREITAGVRFLARAGVAKFILTNAAGTVNPEFLPGSWMMISDHLNFTGATPLSGGMEFLDLTDAYSPTWREWFARVAREQEMILHEGIYAGVPGPQYETPAEVRMLRLLGADAIGMSTVHEVIQARALGLEVAAFSCLTNRAAGLEKAALNHGEVLSAGARAGEEFSRLLVGALARDSAINA